MQTLTTGYPQFGPIVKELQHLPAEYLEMQVIFLEDNSQNWAEAPSIFRDFLNRFHQLVIESPDWDASKIDKRGVKDFDYAKFDLPPWTIPTIADTERIMSVAFVKYYRQQPLETTYTAMSDHYAIPAAALAFKHLGSMSKEFHRSLRHIELVEDRAAVAYPECHMRGLI